MHLNLGELRVTQSKENNTNKKRKNMNNKRTIARKIKNNQYVSIKTDIDFTTFYKELEDYFVNHNLQGIPLEIINDRFFVHENDIKKCEAIYIYHPDICKIEFLPTKTKNSIELCRLEIFSRGHGLGSKFLEIFNKISKKTNIEILLIPNIPGMFDKNISDAEFDTQMKQTRNFYHKNGFKRKGMKTEFWSNS
jgi:hypothetical protein